MNKTLAERLRDAASRPGRDNPDYICVISVADAKAAAEALDRITPPDAGVGLVRWDWEYNGMCEDQSGRFVRYEDAKAALAAKDAEIARLNDLGERYAKDARDWQTVAEVNKDHGEQAVAAEKARGAITTQELGREMVARNAADDRAEAEARCDTLAGALRTAKGWASRALEDADFLPEGKSPDYELTLTYIIRDVDAALATIPAKPETKP